MAEATSEDSVRREERLRHYNEVLRDLWGKYHEIPNRMILLSAGTALLFLQNLSVGPSASGNSALADAALLCSGASLFFAILWRLVSQALMEYETLVPESELAHYYRDAGIERVLIKVNGPRLRAVWRNCYHWVPWAASLLLLASWVCIAKYWKP